MNKMVLEYVLKNPWKQVRGDLKKYFALKRQLKTDEKNLDNAESLITVYDDSDFDRPACIRRKQFYTDSDFPYVDVNYCWAFRFHTCCGMHACPMEIKNMEYIKAAEKYQKSKRLVDSFWQNKIEKVK